MNETNVLWIIGRHTAVWTAADLERFELAARREAHKPGRKFMKDCNCSRGGAPQFCECRETTSVTVEMGYRDCLNVVTHPTLAAAVEYVRSVQERIVSEYLTVDTTYANGETGTVTLTVAEFLGR